MLRRFPNREIKVTSILSGGKHLTFMSHFYETIVLLYFVSNDKYKDDQSYFL